MPLVTILCLIPKEYCMQIVVKIFVKCTTRLNVGTTDYLRVEIMRPGETEVLGSRDILLRIVSESSPAPTDPASSMMTEREFRGDFGSSRRTSSRARDDVSFT
ncbi:hypothetical protein Y032_0122g1095 [Ancylostoma ceylanicum]|uniref:Uncharacterized protein n=1 Tax=Ancylostoma ceylanicum TaxID=53326 RepID=A0A016TA37_9BILA|nr:hypothetical protein Y032_0122g1095 [Ancylostoma ceylanicum]